MDATKNDKLSLERIGDRIERLREYLIFHEPPSADDEPERWFAYLSEMKAIQGNFSNDLSLVACLMARDYLTNRLDLAPFDVVSKPQGANGLDIDARTWTGERVIGEIKTTTPNKITRFGAAQITSFRRDFAKLQTHRAEHKFMFVTDPRSLDALRTGYSSHLQGVKVICLPSGEEFEAEPGEPPGL